MVSGTASLPQKVVAQKCAILVPQDIFHAHTAFLLRVETLSPIVGQDHQKFHAENVFLLAE
jgi:hypothetical protein